jgi:hypothetical protein
MHECAEGGRARCLKISPAAPGSWSFNPSERFFQNRIGAESAVPRSCFRAVNPNSSSISIREPSSVNVLSMAVISCYSATRLHLYSLDRREKFNHYYGPVQASKTQAKATKPEASKFFNKRKRNPSRTLFSYKTTKTLTMERNRLNSNSPHPTLALRAPSSNVD